MAAPPEAQLQRERKYEEALQVCDNILFIDPLNPSGLLLRDVLQDMKMFRDMNLVDLERSRRMNDLSLDNANALIPPTQTVQYPKDWPKFDPKTAAPDRSFLDRATRLAEQARQKRNIHGAIRSA